MKFNHEGPLEVDSLKLGIFKTTLREYKTYANLFSFENAASAVEKGHVGILGLQETGKKYSSSDFRCVFKAYRGSCDKGKHGKWFPLPNLALVLTRSIQEKEYLPMCSHA